MSARPSPVLDPSSRSSTSTPPKFNLQQAGHQLEHQPQHHQRHRLNSLNLLPPLPPPAAASAMGATVNMMTGGFELEEALFSTAPVGLHCVDANGVILWANRTELNFLGFAEDEYVGRYVSSFVYSDKVEAASGSGNILAGGSTAGSNNNNSEQQQQQGGSGGDNVNLITADDKTLYNEVLKRVVGGNPISDIPVRFVTRSGTVIHLLLDCDGTGIHRRSAATGLQPPPPDAASRRYYRFFTRDDTSRRIQEMRSNVLFQETNRSLQMLDNFMNRSMQQMRAPLTLMERACNLVTENIEDIDEVVRRNAAHASMVMMQQNANNAGSGNDDASIAQHSVVMRRSSSRQNLGFDILGEEDGIKPPSASAGGGAIQDYSAPLSVALSATMEARSVVGLASTLTKDALALVDDITDLCRFDQGRVLLIEKEAVKVRDICLEALAKATVPVGSGLPGTVDVSLDIREGAPGRTMTDRSVLQRSLTLLLNFAVDAAANAASALSASAEGGSANGRVILSVSDAAEGQPRGTNSACKISVFYTNPPDAAADGSVGIMGSASGGTGGGSAAAPAETSANAAFASAYTPIGKSHAVSLNNQGGGYAASGGGRPIVRGGSYGTLPAIFGECYSEPDSSYHPSNNAQHHQQGCGSMMRRIRLRESIQSGMTSCRRDKLGLGLSLLYHLVGAQGSDLRYEIVSESTSSPVLPGNPPSNRGGSNSPTMTKFWFLLPMSLDFPDRLPAEHIVKDDLNQVHQHPQHQQNGRQQQQQPSSAFPSSAAVTLAARSSLLPSPFSMVPDGGGVGNMQQQPRQKRARTSSQEQPVAAADSLNVLTADVIGAAVGSLFNHPESASVASAAAAPSAATKLAAASKPPPPVRQYPGVMPGARPLVLVVEDTDVSASLLCMHLRKLNCTSHRAENGEVAIEMLRSAPAPNMYSLILMDLRMPVMDGFEATKIIKGSNASNIPVVALTGETSEENRRRCDEIGFDDYKTKPLKRPQLKELLNKLVPGYTSVG